MRYSFEGYLLDTARRQLSKDDEAIAIEPQVFDLIEFLLRNSERVVTHDELLQGVWGGRLVSESALATRINAARAVLGDSGKEQRLIKTFVRKGFRFVGSFRQEPEVGGDTSHPPTSIQLDQNEQVLRPRTTLPSIAVLPFRSLGKSKESDYFSEGIAEDIVLSLAGLRELFVISRGSTLSFRGNSVDVVAVGRQLGVRYIVSGAVAQVGKRLRVWTELTDVTSGALLWTQRFDGSHGDIFAMQDEIVVDIVSRLTPEIRDAELKEVLRRPPSLYSAYDSVLRALDCFYTLKMDRFEQAGQWLKNAQRIDPTFALSFAWDAWLNMYRLALGWSGNQNNDLEEAGRLATHAIELDARNARALATFGHLRSLFYREYDVGAEYLARALRAGPNDPLAWALSSATNSYSGKHKEAIFQAEEAIRRSPLDRYRYYYMATLAVAHYVDGNFDEAIKWGSISMRENSSFTPSSRYLAAALAAGGHKSEARAVAQIFLEHQPNFTLKSYQALYQPFRDPSQRREHLNHLRLAGLPEG